MAVADEYVATRTQCRTIPTVKSCQNRRSLRLAAHNNRGMPDSAHTVALCCYKERAVVSNRCDLCKAEYACPEFRTKAAVMQFNAMIPASMLLAPLPIELWPNKCADIAPGMASQSTQFSSNGSTDSPLRRFVSTLGLPVDRDPHST
jgi:hypothetical protein